MRVFTVIVWQYEVYGNLRLKQLKLIVGSVFWSKNTSIIKMEPLSLLHKSDADVKTVKSHTQNNKQHNVQNPQNDVHVWNERRTGQSHPGSGSLIATFFQLPFQAAIKNLGVRNKNKYTKMRVHQYKRTCLSRRARCHNRDIWPGKPGLP